MSHSKMEDVLVQSLWLLHTSMKLVVTIDNAGANHDDDGYGTSRDLCVRWRWLDALMSTKIGVITFVRGSSRDVSPLQNLQIPFNT